MTRTDDHLDALVRGVVAGHEADGTPDPQGTDPDSPQARALLATVLATPRGGAPRAASASAGAGASVARSACSTVAASRRPLRARWFALAAAGVLLGGAGLVLPSALQPAFATWTRVPSMISDERAAAMAEGCREMLRDSAQVTSAEAEGRTPAAPDVDRMGTVLADRRGDTTFIVLDGDGWYGSCLVSQDLFTGVRAALGGATGVSGAAALLPIAPDLEVSDDALADVQRAAAGGSGTWTRPWASEWLTARAGHDVRGVVLHTVAGDVTATIAGGYVAAWWPLDVEGAGDAQEAVADSGYRPVSATLTLADGSTREIADINRAVFAPGDG